MTIEALTADELTAYKDAIEDMSGLAVTADALVAITTPSLFGEIRQYGIGDTETNSAIARALSTALLGRDWPTNGDIRDGLDRDQFFTDLRAAAHARGWLEEPPAPELDRITD